MNTNKTTTPKLKIALFGGSFDPVHTDHLNIARTCYDALGFNEVWFLPNYLNPFKSDQHSPKADRLAMLNLVANHYDWLKVNGYEINKEEPSFTFQTLKHFVSLKEYENYEFSFIMGSDQLDSFDQWDGFDPLFNELSDQVKFKVFKRSDDYNQQVVEKYGLEVFDFNRIGLSSTMIRNLEDLFFQIPEVNDYTNYHLLYLPERVASQMDEARFQHSLNVGKMAVELAKVHSLDENKALVAGTLHDITKRWDVEKQRQYLEKYYPKLVNEPQQVWHSFVGRAHLEHDWIIKDNQILQAVFNHTVGYPDMTAFDKIIFCADKISVERDYDGVEEIRNLCLTDLEQGFKAALKQAYTFAVEQHGVENIGTMLTKTYEYYFGQSELETTKGA